MNLKKNGYGSGQTQRSYGRRKKAIFRNLEGAIYIMHDHWSVKFSKMMWYDKIEIL